MDGSDVDIATSRGIQEDQDEKKCTTAETIPNSTDDYESNCEHGEIFSLEQEAPVDASTLLGGTICPTYTNQQKESLIPELAEKNGEFSSLEATITACAENLSTMPGGETLKCAFPTSIEYNPEKSPDMILPENDENNISAQNSKRCDENEMKGKTACTGVQSNSIKGFEFSSTASEAIDELLEITILLSKLKSEVTSGVKHIENELKLNERKRGLEYDALQRQAADSLKHTELPALLEKAEIERIETANSTKEKELFLTRELDTKAAECDKLKQLIQLKDSELEERVTAIRHDFIQKLSLGGSNCTCHLQAQVSPDSSSIIKMLRQSIQDVTAQVVGVQQKCNDYQQDFDRVEREYQAATSLIKDLYRQVEMDQAEMLSLRTAQENLRTRLNETSAQLALKSSQCEVTSNENIAAVAQIKAQREIHSQSDSENQIAQLLERCKAKDESIKTLLCFIEEIQTKTGTLQKEYGLSIAGAESNISSLRVQCSDAEMKLLEIISKHRELEDENIKSVGKITELNIQLESEIAVHASSQQQVRLLNEQLKEISERRVEVVESQALTLKESAETMSCSLSSRINDDRSRFANQYSDSGPKQLSLLKIGALKPLNTIESGPRSIVSVDHQLPDAANISRSAIYNTDDFCTVCNQESFDIMLSCGVCLHQYHAVCVKINVVGPRGSIKQQFVCPQKSCQTLNELPSSHEPSARASVVVRQSKTKRNYDGSGSTYSSKRSAKN